MVKQEAIRDYIARYRHKASLLAVIHSRLASKNRKLDLGHTCAIIFLTALITFLGFFGTERILDSFSSTEPLADSGTKATAVTSISSSGTNPESPVLDELNANTRKAQFDLGFHLVVLFLFVASLLNLIFRWKERYNAHFSGVVKLRQLIGWLDELALLESSSIDTGKLKHIRHQYESIVELLPPNSDRDYTRAKSSVEKRSRAESRGDIYKDNTLNDEQLVNKIVRNSPAMMEVLKVANRQSEALWIGGGSVRTLVWNYLTGRSEDVHDYDVVYFNIRDLNESTEKSIEAQLKEQLPRSIKISVKNQARMHAVNREPKRSSMEDAIANWPETASATAIRLDREGDHIHAIAPYGFEDVLNLVVQPTPYHTSNSQAFSRRLVEKKWKKYWPELEIRNFQ